MDANNINSTEQLLKLNDTLRKHNIGFSAFLFVACVENENLNLTDIAEKISISSAGMTTIRDCAQDNFFVEEVKAEDRRQRVYKITDKGIELLASCRQ